MCLIVVAALRVAFFSELTVVFGVGGEVVVLAVAVNVCVLIVLVVVVSMVLGACRLCGVANIWCLKFKKLSSKLCHASLF